MQLSDLRNPPNALAADYRQFRVDQRLRLTGHSHQAWPDCARHGLERAWQDAAELADEKWDRAFAQAERVRLGFARLLGEDGSGHIALGASTHDLLVRLLSALPLRKRPRLVTTDGEFHSIRRQLERLAEEGVEIVRVPSDPHTRIAERLASAVDDRTCLVLVSSVQFHSALRVPGLDRVMEACHGAGADLLVDTYHHLNVVPFDLSALGLRDAFLVGGGYKYCQLGEGNCFLRFPAHRRLRPVITGWFAEFSALEAAPEQGRVHYDEGPGRMAGATYDPVSHYRAAEVFDYFERRDLGPGFLREVSGHQIGLLAGAFDDLDLPEEVIRRPRDIDLEEVAGFLVLRSPRAADLCVGLRERGVLADSRGDGLRLGPAPYLSDRQLTDAVGILGEVVRG